MSLSLVFANGLAVLMLWLFAAAGLSKLRPAHRAYYQGIMGDYGVNLPELARMLTLLAGGLELAVGIGLLLPATRPLAVIVGAVLLGLYLLVMWRQLAQGKADMDCGCAGPAAAMKLSLALLWRNAFYMAALVICGLLTPGIVTGGGAVWLLSMLLGVMLVLVAKSADQLLGNGQKLKRLQAVMA